MTQLALDDPDLFGNDAGEDEDERLLLSYFVEQPAFAAFLDPARRLWFATGRKGTGKSALLVRFAHALRSAPAAAGAAPPLVLQLVPSQLVALKEPPATDNPILLENYWKQVICGAINMALARDIGVAWSDNQMALVEGAELAGFVGRNLVGALLARLGAKLSLGGIELSSTPRPAANHEQLLYRVERDARQPRALWLLLDDIDAKYQNSAAQQAFVSSFFSACRRLVNDSAGIGIRAAVRSDVWTSLTVAEDMDKVEQYRSEIIWSAAQQRQLLAKRIWSWLQRHDAPADELRRLDLKQHAGELIELAFAARMKWGGASVPPDHVLRVLGGGGPRWIAQLCRMAGANAVRDDKPRIAMHHITQAMGEFGRRRLADLYKEHHYQFADLRRLVESFAGGPRRYTTAELLHRIDQHYVAPSGGQIGAVDGTAYRDPLQLARFLYKCGFVYGDNRDSAELALPEFIGYELRPDLLAADTNLDDGMAWELHPAYRNILKTA